MRQFRSRFEIVLKFIVFLSVKLVLQILFFKLFINLIIRPFRMCCMKYFTKSLLYYQQGSKSLKKKLILSSLIGMYRKNYCITPSVGTGFGISVGVKNVKFLH